MKLVLPFPPSLNSYYGHTRYGQFYIRKKGELYRIAIYRAVRAQVGRILFEDPVAVFLTFNPPVRCLEPWDLDNYKKALFDALTMCNFWRDDSLVHEDHSFKGEWGGKGSVDLRLEYI